MRSLILRSVVTALAPLLASLALRGQVRDIGGQKQLFLDQRFVTEGAGVALAAHAPTKLGVVLTGDRPWDSGAINYGTVLEDEGKLRMWYTAEPVIPTSAADSAVGHLCYAESEDGVHWTKPSLGLFEWQGSTANNILIEVTHPSACVLKDPLAPAPERYKLIARLHARSAKWPQGNAREGSGLYLYTSPDGLRWTLHPQRVLPFDPDTLNMAFYDERSHHYLAYVRTWNPWRRVGVIEMDDLMKPWPHRSGVARAPRVGVGPPTAPSREIDDAFGADEGDPPNLDYYTSATVRYPWAQDAYLMFPSAYHRFPEPPEGRYHNDGILDIDLAVSRDGHRFLRPSRAPYIGLGIPGEGDSHCLYMLIGLLRRGHRLYQYYTGTSYSHGGYVALPEMRNCGSIFGAVQRLDGFVSVDAGDREGHFVTPPLSFRGKRLTLNRDASATGEIRCELQNAEGKPLPGFAFADCEPQFGNEIDQSVAWRAGGDLGHWAGTPVRIAFRLRQARIYAFQFAD